MKFNKKRIISLLSAVAMMVVTPLSVAAYQVSSTGALPLGTLTSMHGYLYRSDSSSYSFNAETTIGSNPYKDASLFVSVTVTPYNTSSFDVEYEEKSTTNSTYVAVTSPSASTLNATSASGSHSATIYNGTQSWGNSGGTSWSKSTGN